MRSPCATGRHRGLLYQMCQHVSRSRARISSDMLCLCSPAEDWRAAPTAASHCALDCRLPVQTRQSFRQGLHPSLDSCLLTRDPSHASQPVRSEKVGGYRPLATRLRPDGATAGASSIPGHLRCDGLQNYSIGTKCELNRLSLAERIYSRNRKR